MQKLLIIYTICIIVGFVIVYYDWKDIIEQYPIIDNAPRKPMLFILALLSPLLVISYIIYFS